MDKQHGGEEGGDGGSFDSQPNATRSPTKDDSAIARANWDRYVYVSERGHFEFCARARRLEELYLGGGLQWRAEDRAHMESEGRYPIEVNEIKDAVNTALGYQINNRVNIAAAPKRNTSEEQAKKFSKILMKVKDDIHYSFYESEMFADGLIQQRGYIDLRVYYDENINGEPGIMLLDPMDVIPDPDAKGYDPDDWGDVTLTRWMTGEEIEEDYGPEKRAEIEADYNAGIGEEDFGDSLNEESRNRFGDDLEDSQHNFDALDITSSIPRYRVIDRQYWKMSPVTVAVFPTGDIRKLENANQRSIQQAEKDGAIIIRRPMKRIRWTVSTENVLLHDDWSPYDHFTIIPFFPVFRRGKTAGMIDTLEGPQELLNSSISTVHQIVRGSANSGWTVEQNSLTNMDTDDLEEQGSRNGLVIEYQKGSTKPEKIKPNEVPQGFSDLVSFASNKIKTVSGINEAARGQGGKNQSGLAVQAQQFASQLSEAKTLSNLGFTRKLFAIRLTKMLQQTLTDPQVFRITETGPKGVEQTVNIYANQFDPETNEFFDMTAGEYDFTITDQPAHITFQNSQHEQAMEMRRQGIPIPDHEVIRTSNLENKAEIIQQMAAATQANPEQDAKVVLIKAQAELAKANTVAKTIEALFSGARTAEVLAANPGLAPAADSVVKSAGFEDKDPPPIYPADAPAAPPPPTNTNPLTPDNPQAGVNAGIERGM